MAVQVQTHTDAAQPKSREELMREATAKVTAGRAEPATSPQSGGTSPTTVLDAAKPGETTPAQTGNRDDVKAAIERERERNAVREATRKLQETTSELERVRGLDAARKADWRKALADAGHNPAQVVKEWVEGEDSGAAGPQTSAQQQGGSELETALQRIKALEDMVASGRQLSAREQRIAGLRNIASGESDAYEVMSALGMENDYLGEIERREKENGSSLGELELKEALREIETQRRTVVDGQIRKLLSTKWGRTNLTALLKAIEPGEQQTGTDQATEPTRPGRSDLMNVNAAPASRVIDQGQLSDSDFRKKARDLAVAKLRR